ncbi:MAG: MFS transporter, partial [Sedimenticola sp.]|nr:MFS transporter [Sedimenticola sp.]
AWSIVVLVPGLSIPLLVLLLILAGFFSGNMIIGFAFARESAPIRLAGTASGLVNMGVMIGPMLLQPAVGALLDHYWTGEVENGVRVYGLDAYQNGFSLMLGWLVLALLLMFFTRETHCKQIA